MNRLSDLENMQTYKQCSAKLVKLLHSICEASKGMRIIFKKYAMGKGQLKKDCAL
jgi:hypothetical protein